MSGGKGGSTTSEVTVPAYIENAARANLAKADSISQVGYTPYYGADVAAFNPMQQASFQNTADSASAFGMATPTSPTDIMGNMGAPQTYANGVTGYSSAPMFQDAVDTLGYFRPNQKALMDSFFVNPYTGFDPSGAYSASPASGVAMEMQGQNPSFRPNTTDYGSNSSYYNNPNGGFANVVIGYDANGSPIMSTQPAASGDLGGIGAVDPAVQDLLDQRRQSRSDDNYQRLLDEMSKNNSFGAKLGVQEMQDLADVISPNNYNPRRDTIGNTMTPEQMNNLSQEQRIAQEDIAMNMMGVANMGMMDGVKNITNIMPTSFNNPSSGRFFGGLMEDGSPRPDNVGGSYGGSLINGQITNLTGMPSTLARAGAEVVSALDFGRGVDMQSAYNRKLAADKDAQAGIILAQVKEAERQAAAVAAAQAAVSQPSVDNRSNEERRKKQKSLGYTPAAGKKAAMTGWDE
tara:strand:- start:4378 stop:5760 length:1383 start_codon:yes stop_codon:yes gene_type:complete